MNPRERDTLKHNGFLMLKIETQLFWQFLSAILLTTAFP